MLYNELVDAKTLCLTFCRDKLCDTSLQIETWSHCFNKVLIHAALKIVKLWKSQNLFITISQITNFPQAALQTVHYMKSSVLRPLKRKRKKTVVVSQM